MGPSDLLAALPTRPCCCRPTCRLLSQLQGGTEELHREAMEVSRQLSLLQRDVAPANGWAMLQVVTSRCHLWLAQSRLTPALQSIFSTHPLTPGLTFGPGVDDILEQTDKVCRYRETLRRFMPRPQAPGPMPPTCIRITVGSLSCHIASC